MRGEMLRHICLELDAAACARHPYRPVDLPAWQADGAVADW
jgi:hypothetical protein